MKYCPECGSKVEGMKFCSECGHATTNSKQDNSQDVVSDAFSVKENISTDSSSQESPSVEKNDHYNWTNEINDINNGFKDFDSEVDNDFDNWADILESIRNGENQFGDEWNSGDSSHKTYSDDELISEPYIDDRSTFRKIKDWWDEISLPKLILIIVIVLAIAGLAQNCSDSNQNKSSFLNAGKSATHISADTIMKTVKDSIATQLNGGAISYEAASSVLQQMVDRVLSHEGAMAWQNKVNSSGPYTADEANLLGDELENWLNANKDWITQDAYEYVGMEW